MAKGTEVYGPLAEDYARYRPWYPAEVLGVLVKRCGLVRGQRIADIGSGTGRLAYLFVSAGYEVVGIEPNHAMRKEAERLLAAHPRFHSVAGTAEQIPVSNRSVDLVAVGQALHWFDAKKARAEFRRILRPGGWIAVVWNDRGSDERAFAREYHALTRTSAIAQPSPCVVNAQSAGLDCVFDGTTGVQSAAIGHVQHLDLMGFLGRARSTGHVPQEGAAGHAVLTAALTELFYRYEHAGTVEFQYVARLFFAQVDACGR